MRTQGIPLAAGEPAYLFRDDQLLKRHPAYTAAKSGDSAAAVDLVRDLAEPLRTTAERFGSGVIFVAPHALEATGDNAIPQTLAAFLAVASVARSDTAIAQANRVFHTGANAMERLIAPSEFVGAVELGGRYVLVDDVTTMGGTLADLSAHIQAGGGLVVGSVVLVNAARSGRLHAAPAVLRKIEERFGDEIKDILCIEPAALTAEEAGYVVGFRTADELRTRAAAAQKERDRRLRAKGVYRDEA